METILLRFVALGQVACFFSRLDNAISICARAGAGSWETVLGAYLNVLLAFWRKSDGLIKRLGLNINGFTRLTLAVAWMGRGTFKVSQGCREKRVPAINAAVIDAFSREVPNPTLFQMIGRCSLRTENSAC